MLITVEVFDDNNYDLWEKAARTALKSKNKLGFIAGTLTKSELKGGNFMEYHALGHGKLNGVFMATKCQRSVAMT